MLLLTAPLAINIIITPWCRWWWLRHYYCHLHDIDFLYYWLRFLHFLMLIFILFTLRHYCLADYWHWCIADFFLYTPLLYAAAVILPLILPLILILAGYCWLRYCHNIAISQLLPLHFDAMLPMTLRYSLSLLLILTHYYHYYCWCRHYTLRFILPLLSFSLIIFIIAITLPHFIFHTPFILPLLHHYSH